jgi:hypothetical protein
LKKVVAFRSVPDELSPAQFGQIFRQFPVEVMLEPESTGKDGQ